MLMTIFLALVLAMASGGAAPAIQQNPPCSDDPAFAALDFWVGEWTVWVDGQRVGTNLIRKVQGGCAIEEHWTDIEGGTGQSLFYYLPVPGEWRQVWVTPAATVPGGLKEKQQVEAPADSVRFQGTIARPDAAPYLDRTTLTPLAGGTVRQHIEVSMDGGASWRTTFDAEYRPLRGS